MNTLLIALVLVFALSARAIEPPTTVDELDLTKFVGTWYQMASDWIVLNTFEKDAFCATAKYTAMPDGRVEVITHTHPHTRSCTPTHIQILPSNANNGLYPSSIIYHL
jgi:lipocalin